MEFTIAAAMKKIKQLTEEKAYWESIERDSCTYIASINEDPVIPEYDYRAVSDKIQSLDNEIRAYRSAIHRANVNEIIQVNLENDYRPFYKTTVDGALTEMATLNKRKAFLDDLRKKLPKQRVTQAPYATRSRDPEYEYINFDPELVREDYERISNRISAIQMAIDKHNQTFTVDVPQDGEIYR